MYGIRITDEHNYGDRKVAIFRTEHPLPETELALELLARWGQVAAAPDGEDSAGRQAMRLQAPAEIVRRAFDVAVLAYAEARERGLMVALPDLNEVNRERDAERAAEREAKAAKKEANRV